MSQREEGAAPKRGPVALCVLDGWGLREAAEGNAVALARTPVYDSLRDQTPMASLKTSGQDVGLPDGQMGNSEVGHMNLGAGRVVWMDLPKIDKAIAEDAFAGREAFAAFRAALRAGGGAAHLMGLMSPGGVHAHQRHIAAAARALAADGVPVRLHLFLDGRDVGPSTAPEHWRAFSQEIEGLPNVTVATVSGRFYAMDRDKRWERVAAAHRAITLGAGHGGPAAADPAAAIAQAAAAGETDEFVTPTVIGDYAGVAAGDGLFMANFRADRAREILTALLDPGFDGFERAAAPAFGPRLGMVSYSDALDPLIPTLFPAETIENGLGAWAAAHGLRQLRLAETEKYPHVTFFFNGGVETPSEGERRHMAPSPKVRTYDLAPEMAAAEVSATLNAAIAAGEDDLIIVNFANPDMVGHTGSLEAAITAVERVDRAVGEAWAALEAAGGAMLVTADHGNCELMIDPETGGPHTAHTTHPVPIALIDARPGEAGRWALAEGGRLADVAPTLLALLGLAQPAEMTGRSLLIAKAETRGAGESAA
ncbi:MAG: 2,3-bisphosphoglycerate-independent phosphoglycerate mutase [Pseudomonadota bacterium]